MSGVFKAVGKVFKKVVKVVKKVAPFALAAAAVVFTGGAALGVLPSFSTAVGGLVSSLGVGSSLGGLLTGAITKAGFGAALGGLVGGKKGMTSGLLAGAAMGALGAASGLGGAPAAGAATPGVEAAAASGGGWNVPIDGSPMAVAGAPAAGGLMASAAPVAASGGGLMGGLLGNPLVTSQLLQGLGNGLMARSQSRAEERAREKEAANYSVKGGLLDPSVMSGYAPDTQGNTGGNSFDQNAQLKWTYDARAGKMVRIGGRIMGLMPTPGKVEEQAPPEGQRDPARYTDETDGNVSPEEQAQYSQFEQNYMAIIYDGSGGVRPGILEALQKEGEQPAPVEATGEEDAPDAQEIGQIPPQTLALANAAVMIVSKLDDSARSGQPLTDDVLLQGGVAVIEELAEVAEAAGIHDYSQDELDGAATVAMDLYRDKAIADGRTDADTLKGQWDEVLAADQEGRLQEVIPGAPAKGQE